MASKFLCECGYVVRINAFEGHEIFHLISDKQVDALTNPLTTDDVVDMWFESQELIKCKGCSCLHLWDEVSESYVRYVRSND